MKVERLPKKIKIETLILSPADSTYPNAMSGKSHVMILSKFISTIIKHDLRKCLLMSRTHKRQNPLTCKCESNDGDGREPAPHGS